MASGSAGVPSWGACCTRCSISASPSLAGSDVVAGLPDVLRVPLSEPLFILGVLFILVVMFLPGGIAGTIDAWWRRRRGERVRAVARAASTTRMPRPRRPVEVRA